MYEIQARNTWDANGRWAVADIADTREQAEVALNELDELEPYSQHRIRRAPQLVER